MAALMNTLNKFLLVTNHFLEKLEFLYIILNKNKNGNNLHNSEFLPLYLA